ncbi:MAG: TIR domain-containing protein [Chitinophagaceae bacterium]|nr:TIR domain-containing protein [Chitinophagaceae bacterium]
MSALISPPLKIYISYAHSNAAEKNKIVSLLSKYTDQYEVLPDDLLYPGDVWDKKPDDSGMKADIFLLLISPFYLQSKTVSATELPQIMKRGEAGEAYVIPVILESCNWSDQPYANFEAVPEFGTPISNLPDTERGYAEIIEAIEIIHRLLQNRKALNLIKKFRESPNETELDLSGCGLLAIPPDLLTLQNIRKLHLQNNRIGKINNLKNLEKLEYLDLSDNEITVVENLNELKKIRYLDLQKNTIRSIHNLHNHTQLEELGLSSNRLESLRGIEHLLQLKTLYAARNEITDLAELGTLNHLKRIVLTDNPISSIRSLLPLIKNKLAVHCKYALKKDEYGLFVKGCPISDPPLEVVEMGAEAILDHYNKHEKHGEKKLEILKLVLVGNSGTGKTNFSQFLRKKKQAKDHISTDTLDIQSWRPSFLRSAESGEPMLVNIFDFGGQDYYHDLHRLYYSHDTAYVLLWDIVSNCYAERTEKLKDGTELVFENFPIEYWLESIKYNLYGKEVHDYEQLLKKKNRTVDPKQDDTTGKAMTESAVVKKDLSTTAPVLVLQNKIDLGEGLLDQVYLREAYPNITTFYNISLEKESRVRCIEEVMDTCLSKLNLSGRRLISYQHEIIEQYIQGNNRFEVLSFDAFKDKCAALLPAHRNVVLDDEDVKVIASVLTNIGIVYFDQPDPAGTTGVVFTRIDELNNLIKKIMNEAKNGNEKGIFSKKQVVKINHIDHLLPLLIRNNSIIPLSNDTFLVPQFLPVTAEPHIENFTKAFLHCHIRYIYTAYFHKSLLMSLFAKFVGGGIVSGTDSEVKVIYYWRNGLILSQETNHKPQMVFIHFLKEASACRIEIRTLHPFGKNGLERDIEAELDELNKGWSHRKEVSVNSTDFFDVTQMIKDAAQKKYIFTGANQSFTVNDFRHLITFEKVPKKLFISYSSKNSEFIKRFWTHLDVLKTAGDIEPWYDRKIEPGTQWNETIQKEMQKADLVIFLLSPDFLATSYIMKEEVKKAMDLEDSKQCELYFIQLLPCSWEETDLRKYQLFLDPAQSGKQEYLVGTPDNDKAWKTIMNELKIKISK